MGGSSSYADWLDVLSPHLCEGLASRDALARVRRVAARFPGDDLAALELRLAAGAPRIDFSFRLSTSAAARAVADRFGAGHVHRLLRGWGDGPGAAFPAAVSAIWLELDLPVEGGSGGPVRPIVCARLCGRAGAGATDVARVDAVFSRVAAGPIAPEGRRLLRRAVEGLPPGARALYAIGLHPRSRAGVRLEVVGLEPWTMAEYLAPLAERETVERLADLAPLIGGADRYHLSFDVEDRLLPRIGVEVGWVRPPGREPGWARTLELWTAEGVVAAGRAGAVLAWSGRDNLWTAAERWPVAEIGSGGHLARCLSHLKLVSSPGRPPEAKAYLLFQHVVRQPASPTGSA